MVRYILALGIISWLYQPAEGQAQLLGYDSYTECMHEEAQETDNPKMGLIRRYCGNLMKYEHALPDYVDDQITVSWQHWSRTGHAFIKLELADNNSSYHVTEITAQISPLACGSITSWNGQPRIAFKFEEVGGGFLSTSSPSLIADAEYSGTGKPKCMRRISYKGYYK